MNRPVVAALAVVLSGALLFVISKSGGGGEDDAPQESNKAKRQASSRSDRKSDRAPRPKGPASAASKTMREILERGLQDIPPFEKTDDFAGSLSDAELKELIETVGLTSSQGGEGWVRSALFAEWGRRNPLAAIAYLEAPPGDPPARWAHEQSWFAVYRGWAEQNPDAAIVALLESERQAEEEGTPSASARNYWSGFAFTEIFKNFTDKDPDGAWDALPEGPHRIDALRGIFEGAPSSAQLREFIDKWVTDWNSDEAIKAPGQDPTQINSSLSGEAGIPPDETIARHAALAMARFSLEEAEQWLAETGPGDASKRNNRRMALLGDWASANPGSALELIGTERYPIEIIGRGAIQGDPSLAVEVMKKIPDAGTRARTLLSGLSGLGSNHVTDFFPTPDGLNRVPDFADRYAHILAAVEAGEFEEGQAQTLVAAANRSFQHQVAAAREATAR